MMMCFTIIICTHNRAELLQQCLGSLNDCARPDAAVDILVIANACTDNSVELLRDYKQRQPDENLLPLNWAEEPQAGKSHALNHAIKLLATPVAVFVDDDQTADFHFLSSIRHALSAFQDASILCGRLLPAWTGNEPAWLHEEGPYRIYPPPVASYDCGDEMQAISTTSILPPGGDIIVRKEVFSRLGGFSTSLGPQGHDLLGGEDSQFLSHALDAGETLMYVPGIVQYHAVVAAHLELRYLLRKSFQRSRSVTRIAEQSGKGIPLYMWKKVLIYLMQSLFSLSWSKTRFYLTRLAAVLGEIKGISEAAAYRRETL